MARLDQDPAGSARWWLERARNSRTARRDAVISTESIVAAATRLVEEAGVDRLTMRQVASALDVSVSALYGHVRSRDEILVLLQDELLGVLDQDPPAGLDWRETMRWMALAFGDHLRSHPAALGLLRTPTVFGPKSIAARNRALQVLLGAGLTPVEAIELYSTLSTFVVGAAHRGTLEKPALDESYAREQLFKTAEEEGLDHIGVEVAVMLTLTPDRFFATGVDIVLDGVAARVDARRRSSVE